MTVRTFKQMGQAYGSSPVQIVAKIDGVEIFNGSVPALDTPTPLPGATVADVELFSWPGEVAFSGNKIIEIIVSGGSVLLTDTLGNYVADQTIPPVGEPGFPKTPVSAGPDVYSYFYGHFALDPDTTPPESNIWVLDPLSNVTINGMPRVPAYTPTQSGQWNWLVPAGSVFNATLSIEAGYE
jgi:hypothetical protein